MVIAALLIITRRWKQPKYPTINESINKMWHICTMDRKEKVSIHATK
jgi:hypothetical protein